MVEAEEVKDGGVQIKSGEAQAVVKMLFPQAQVREEVGLANHNPKLKQTYLAFSPETQTQSCQFITAIGLNPDAMPKFEVLQTKDYIGIRMRTAEAVEEYYLNLRAIDTPGTISIQIEDWVTDAYLLHLKYATGKGQSVQRFFLGDGSYLRRKDRSIIESLSKLTVSWAPGDPLEIFSNGASDSIQIAAEQLPRSIEWNGRRMTGKYDSQSRLIDLHL